MPEITSVELASVSNTDGVPVAKDRLNFHRPSCVQTAVLNTLTSSRSEVNHDQ